MRTLVVMGGSSPFTLALALALAQEPPWEEGSLLLQGRDSRALAAVTRVAASLLVDCGWSVGIAGLDEGVARADVVLHQNRYGGLSGRASDERLATTLGLPVDETLGVGGLSAALRTAHGQSACARLLAARSPHLPVLTMTNPLGISTSHFAAAGVSALGTCELPEATRLTVAAALGADPAELTGSYVGLNHRGFWYDLHVPAGPAMPMLAARGEAGHPMPGIDLAALEELGAVVSSYHGLLTGSGHLRAGRAAALRQLRAEVLTELQDGAHTVPAALFTRDMPWYRLIVVPVLRALAGERSRVVLTLCRPGGTAEEQQVDVEGPALRPVQQRSPPAAVRAWVQRLRRHEQAVLAAALEPDLDGVREALALDPTVPSEAVDPAAALVHQTFEQWASQQAS